MKKIFRLCEEQLLACSLPIVFVPTNGPPNKDTTNHIQINVTVSKYDQNWIYAHRFILKNLAMCVFIWWCL